MSKLNLTLCTFSITGSVAGLFLTLRSGGTMSVELHWRLIDRLGNDQNGSLFTLLLNRPRGNFLTTELLR